MQLKFPSENKLFMFYAKQQHDSFSPPIVVKLASLRKQTNSN